MSEADLRKAVADAVTAERTLWGAADVLQKEDNDARLADLVGYWLARVDRSIRPDWLQALKAATGKATYKNLINTQLKADIKAINSADALFERVNDTVYIKSGQVDGAKAALTPSEAAATTAVAKAKNAKKAFDRANSAKPKNQSAVNAAQTACDAAALCHSRAPRPGSCGGPSWVADAAQ